MAEEFVSQVLLEINGKSITDFKTVEEKEFELHKTVNLMNTTGHTSSGPRGGSSRVRRDVGTRVGPVRWC